MILQRPNTQAFKWRCSQASLDAGTCNQTENAIVSVAMSTKNPSLTKA